MITETSIDIEAPADHVWAVYADVASWPGWTASIRSVEGALAPGAQVRIRQPRFPTLVWEVTALDPGRSWTWRQHSPGATTLASHEVVPLGPDRTRVHQRIDQRGPLGVAVGVLTRRLTRRYLRLEADGLKARCEADRAPSP